MKFKALLILFIFSLITSQDRSTIFTTYTGDEPDPSAGGYSIQYIDNAEENQIYGAANKFFISNEYVLERAYVYMTHIVEDAFQVQQIEVRICEDNNGEPGEILTSNIITLNPGDSEGDWYSTSLLSQCAKTNESAYHWMVVLPLEGTDATWVYSNEPNFTYSTTENNGQTWSDDQNGFAGTSYLTAEQIYIPPFSGGDINGDFIVNVLDIVFMVQYIIGNQELTEEQLAAGDLTQDGGINILDIVALMSIITGTNTEPVTDFLYEDINSNSETFTEDVGPPIYEGQISAYYFGKAG